MPGMAWMDPRRRHRCPAVSPHISDRISGLTKTSDTSPFQATVLVGEPAGLSDQSGRDCARTYSLTVSRLAPPQLATK